MLLKVMLQTKLSRYVVVQKQWIPAYHTLLLLLFLLLLFT